MLFGTLLLHIAFQGNGCNGTIRCCGYNLPQFFFTDISGSIDPLDAGLLLPVGLQISIWRQRYGICKQSCFRLITSKDKNTEKVVPFCLHVHFFPADRML